jgi:hypothetical protein
LKLQNVGQLIGALLCTSTRSKPPFPNGICCNAKVFTIFRHVWQVTKTIVKVPRTRNRSACQLVLS